MKAKGSVRLACVAALTLLVAGCRGAGHSADAAAQHPVAKERYPFVIRVHTFEAAAGVGLDYYLTYESIVIATHNDWGKPEKEVYSRTLTETEQEHWRAFVASLPLTELKDVYEDAGIAGGLHVYFTFELGSEERDIALKNTRQDELFKLCDEIDRLVPEDLRIGIEGMPVREELGQSSSAAHAHNSQS